MRHGKNDELRNRFIRIGKSQTQDIRREYFGESLPASTRVQVAGLDGPSLLIEIDAIAMIPEN